VFFARSSRQLRWTLRRALAGVRRQAISLHCGVAFLLLLLGMDKEAEGTIQCERTSAAVWEGPNHGFNMFSIRNFHLIVGWSTVNVHAQKVLTL
jgi:hypothetical protein